MKMSRGAFEQLVKESLEMVPEEFLNRMSNVQVIVEDEPDQMTRTEFRLRSDETLFGVYEGVPLTERTTEYSALPDRIVIFRRPLLEEFDDPLDIRREVARTVIHEVAHHFGIDEERLVELGWD